MALTGTAPSFITISMVISLRPRSLRISLLSFITRISSSHFWVIATSCSRDNSLAPSGSSQRLKISSFCSLETFSKEIFLSALTRSINTFSNPRAVNIELCPSISRRLWITLKAAFRSSTDISLSSSSGLKRAFNAFLLSSSTLSQLILPSLTTVLTTSSLILFSLKEAFSASSISFIAKISTACLIWGIRSMSGETATLSPSALMLFWARNTRKACFIPSPTG